MNCLKTEVLETIRKGGAIHCKGIGVVLGVDTKKISPHMSHLSRSETIVRAGTIRNQKGTIVTLWGVNNT